MQQKNKQRRRFRQTIKKEQAQPLSRLLLRFPHLPSEEKRLARLPDFLNNELLKEQKALVGAVGEIRDALRSISTAFQKFVEVVEMKFQPHIDEENMPASSSEIPDVFFLLIS